MALSAQVFQKFIDDFGFNPEEFQLLNPPEKWNWKDLAASGLIDNNVFAFCDQIPKQSKVFQRSGASLYLGYRYILNEAVNISETPEQVEKMAVVKRDINQAEKEVLDEKNKARQQFNMGKHLGDVPQTESFDKWLDSGDGSMYKKVIEVKDKEVTRLSKLLEDIKAQFNHTYYAALKASKMPDNPLDIKPGFMLAEDRTKHVPNYTVSEYPHEWVRSQSAGDGGFTLTLSAATSSKLQTSDWADGALAARGFFITASTTASEQEEIQVGEDGATDISIHFEALNTVSVKPDEAWFNSSYLKGLHNKNYWNESYTTDKVFGKGGILPLMITSILVGFRMEFSITLSEAAHKNHSKRFLEAAKISIGPFVFTRGTGTVGSDSHSFEADSQKNTFTGKTNSKDPVIVGCTVSQPGIY